MKNLIYILLFVPLCFSCDDDKDEKEVSIVGNWQGDRLDVKAVTGIINLYEETDEDFDGTMAFAADGTVVYKRDNVESPGTYTVADKKLTTDADLKLYNVSGPVTFDIIVLTETKLQLRLNETRQVMVQDIGEVPVTVTATLEFNRL